MLACRRSVLWSARVSISSWVFRTKSSAFNAAAFAAPAFCGVLGGRRICPRLRGRCCVRMFGCGLAGVAPSASAVGGAAAALSRFCRLPATSPGMAGAAARSSTGSRTAGSAVGLVRTATAASGGGCRCRHNERGAHRRRPLHQWSRQFPASLLLRPARLVRRRGGLRPVPPAADGFGVAAARSTPRLAAAMTAKSAAGRGRDCRPLPSVGRGPQRLARVRGLGADCPFLPFAVSAARYGMHVARVLRLARALPVPPSSSPSNVPDVSPAGAPARPECDSGRRGRGTTGSDATWGKASPHQAHGSAMRSLQVPGHAGSARQ